MESKIIEATSDWAWSKFLLLRLTRVELDYMSRVGGSRLFSGYNSTDILVVDVDTGEGAFFSPGGHVQADLTHHAIWHGPLFKGFLSWLYKQDLTDLTSLPDHLDLAGNEGHAERAPGPLDVLLKKCLVSSDKETRLLARKAWAGIHGGSLPPGTPPSLADFKHWTGES